MSLLSNDALTQLSFSVHGNKGVFALLLGSGLSRAASIPTGWEITVDLIRRIASARGVEEASDWVQWYRDETGTEPDYSQIVAELGPTPDERRSILHSYIEPDEDERADGLKLPTKAHKAIARLVRSGFIRVILTTNFDRLMENALREEGVEPTVISSVDTLSGAEPIIHASAYVVKIHGDYKDARILNTDEELAAYPAEYDRLLDRILDEHGLITCGWSGEWDHALRAAIMRAPARRYPLFWAARGRVGTGAEDIIRQRRGTLVEISDADTFFGGLEQRVETLARTHKQNPLTIDLLVATAKRYLAKPDHRIQLDDLFAAEVSSAISKIEKEAFSVNDRFDATEFRNRVATYEAHIEGVCKIAGSLGRWGDGSEVDVVADALKAILHQAEIERSGMTVWLDLRAYPVVLMAACYALGLLRARRWEVLHDFYTMPVKRPRDGDVERVVDNLFVDSWPGAAKEIWLHLKPEKHYRTPFSEHLIGLLGKWGGSFMGPVPDFEQTYGMWEVLGSFAYVEKHDLAELESVTSRSGADSVLCVPIGRSRSNRDFADRIFTEVTSEPIKGKLLSARFWKSNPEFLEKSLTNFRRFVQYGRRQ